MQRFIILSVLVTSSFAVLPLNRALDDEWELFKSQYNKVYEDSEDISRRFMWENNLQKIHKHNNESDNGYHTYYMGMNTFGDMTVYEFKQTMNGYKMSKHSGMAGEMYYSMADVDSLPNEVDWRKKGYVTPIKDQGQCGSCWAFSATGSLEGQHFKKEGTLTSLSEQNLVDCSGTEGNMGCYGGLMDQAFEYIKKNKGIDTETSYPYEAKDDSCRFKKADVGATDNGYVDITKGSEDDLMIAVADVGPISVGIDASHDSFQFYKSGVYNEPECNSTLLDHGVLAVGYGTLQGKDYWLVKNSWGTDWGMKGYIYMSRNKQNQCGIATAASFPKV